MVLAQTEVVGLAVTLESDPEVRNWHTIVFGMQIKATVDESLDLTDRLHRWMIDLLPAEALEYLALGVRFV